jgi:hypothetical protein
MILYRLHCPSAHEFEAWFADSQRFEQQAEAGLILCPICNSQKIKRAPMAPYIAKHPRVLPKAALQESAPALPGAPDQAVQERASMANANTRAKEMTASTANSAAPPPPGLKGEMQPGAGSQHELAQAMALRMGLVMLRRKIEAECEPVGTAFAQEVRKIHYGEAPERPIYGEATRSEREDLAQEGIAVITVPWIENSEH